MKTPLVVLKRLRAGDEDLILKAYCKAGSVDVLVRGALQPKSEFFGVFEPFTFVEVDLKQKSSLLIPVDLLSRAVFLCRPLTYLKLRWCSWVSYFFLKNIPFYEEDLFRLLVFYLSLGDIKNPRALKLKFKLDVLKCLGSGIPKVKQRSIKVGSRRLLQRLIEAKIEEIHKFEISQEIFKECDNLLEELIQQSLS